MSKHSNKHQTPETSRALCFGEFRLGTELRRNDVPVDLTPKAIAVLRLLVERQGHLVTKDELWSTVWPRVIVTDAALTVCMAELRRVLGDDARHPQFIATVPKRGYRFLPAVREDTKPPASVSQSARQLPHGVELVGRVREVAALREAFGAALCGERRLVFVVGEPGIGKTALLGTVAEEFAQAPSVRLIRGQCSEHFGPSEAYLALFDGLGESCRSEGGQALLDCLVRHAPLWLAQLPSLLERVDRTALEQRLVRASPERMMRELAEAVEAFAAADTLVVLLEDIHWSDQATLDWLAFMARRAIHARLLIICTLRETAALPGGHPLRNVMASLAIHPHYRHLEMARLEPDSVSDYLRARVGALAGCATESEFTAVSAVLHARTDGNPLFLTNLLEDALAHVGNTGDQSLAAALMTAITLRPIPHNLTQFITHQIEQVTDDARAVLEAAAVSGEQVAPALVAAVLDIDEEQAERRCEKLSRETHLLQQAGMVRWPDGTVATRYLFKHSLYRELIYARIPAGRLVRVHRAIGQRLERAYGTRATEIAAELAVHFARGNLPAPAAHWSLHAGRTALARAAYTDAEQQFRAGLARLDESGSHESKLELSLQTALGNTLIALRGWAAPSAEQAFARAYHLGSAGGAAERFTPLWGMAMGTVVRADFARYRNLGRELLSLSDALGQPLPRACAQWAIGQHLFHTSEFENAEQWLDRAIEGFGDLDRTEQIKLLGTDFHVFSLCYRMHLAWIRGDVTRTEVIFQEVQARAAASEHPFTTVLAQAYSALLHLFSSNAEHAARAADIVIGMSRDHGFEYYRGWGEFVRGAVESEFRVAEQRMSEGLAAMESGGARLRRAYYLALLAERRVRAGDLAGGHASIDAARDELMATHERCWEAEITRIEGVLYEHAGDLEAAVRCFEQAATLASMQRAYAFERLSLSALKALSERRVRDRTAGSVEHSCE